MDPYVTTINTLEKLRDDRAALLTALKWAEACITDAGRGDVATMFVLNKARAAIAKAEA